MDVKPSLKDGMIFTTVNKQDFTYILGSLYLKDEISKDFKFITSIENYNEVMVHTDDPSLNIRKICHGEHLVSAYVKCDVGSKVRLVDGRVCEIEFMDEFFRENLYGEISEKGVNLYSTVDGDKIHFGIPDIDEVIE